LYEVFHSEDESRFSEVGKGVPQRRLLLTRNELADDANLREKQAQPKAAPFLLPRGDTVWK